MTNVRIPCGCGHGYQSPYDGKCGNCRSRKEQKAWEDKRFKAWKREEALEKLKREMQERVDANCK
jgi:hypothetical protein